MGISLTHLFPLWSGIWTNEFNFLGSRLISFSSLFGFCNYFLMGRIILTIIGINYTTMAGVWTFFAIRSTNMVTTFAVTMVHFFSSIKWPLCFEMGATISLSVWAKLNLLIAIVGSVLVRSMLIELHSHTCWWIWWRLSHRPHFDVSRHVFLLNYWFII